MPELVPLTERRQFQFEWDQVKAAAHVRKHGVTFELAATVFIDPHLLTTADLEHSDGEERWFCVWEYFSRKATEKEIRLSDLLTDVLKRDIEINEALK